MGSGLFSGLLRVFGIGFEGQIWCRCFHDWFRGFTWFNLGVCHRSRGSRGGGGDNGAGFFHGAFLGGIDVFDGWALPVCGEGVCITVVLVFLSHGVILVLGEIYGGLHSCGVFLRMYFHVGFLFISAYFSYSKNFETGPARSISGGYFAYFPRANSRSSEDIVD